MNCGAAYIECYLSCVGYQQSCGKGCIILKLSCIMAQEALDYQKQCESFACSSSTCQKEMDCFVWVESFAKHDVIEDLILFLIELSQL